MKNGKCQINGKWKMVNGKCFERQWEVLGTTNSADFLAAHNGYARTQGSPWVILKTFSDIL